MTKLLNVLMIFTVAALFTTAYADEGRNKTNTAKLYPGADKAIDKGLAYLQKVQKEDGSWGNKAPTAATSVCIMAFMLKGHVPGRGKYGRTMERGIDWLVKHGQSQRGYLGTPNNHAGMYEHGLAILALSEAWGQSKNPKLRDTLRRAVDVTLRAQNDKGGWRYSPEPKDADLSMTVMHCVALNSAKESGIAVPDKTIEKAAEYVLTCQVKANGGFAYTAQTNRGGSGQEGFARTAAGVMSLIMCGKRKDNTTQRGLAFLKSYPDNKYDYKFSRFHYAHYYAIQAMYQTGDKNFNAWYPKVSQSILKAQTQDGAWDRSAFKTSMCILIIGVPYRYLPIYQR